MKTFTRAFYAFYDSQYSRYESHKKIEMSVGSLSKEEIRQPTSSWSTKNELDDVDAELFE